MDALDAWNIAVRVFRWSRPQEYTSYQDWWTFSPSRSLESEEGEAYKTLAENNLIHPRNVARGL